MNPKVLVASPTYSIMKYCQDVFLNRLRNLTYPNYDILIIDNSKEDNFFEELKNEKGITVIKDDCKENENLKRLVSSRNKILEYAIKNNYNYVLMMDSDVIPPENIIEELLDCKKDIVSGLYYNNFVVSGKVKLEPVCWLPITEKEFEEMKKIMNFPENMKAKDLRRHITNEEAESKRLLEVLYPSAGCMLISRKVMEKVRYGLLDTNIKTGDDIFFIDKAREAGFEIYCHTGLKCEHLFSEKLVLKDGNLEHPLFDSS